MKSDKDVPLIPSQRGLLCFMIFLAGLFKTQLRNIIAMEIVCMTSAQENPFSWSVKEQTFILSSGIFGFSVVMPFGGLVILKIGSKNTMAGGILLAAVMALLSPLAARTSPYTLMAAESIKGEFYFKKLYLYCSQTYHRSGKEPFFLGL